jgi:hypothetical protein
MVSWWRAENNASDAIGANHGTLTNGTTVAPGRAGQAFALDGANDYVNIPDSASSFSATSPCSVLKPARMSQGSSGTSTRRPPVKLSSAASLLCEFPQQLQRGTHLPISSIHAPPGNSTRKAALSAPEDFTASTHVTRLEPFAPAASRRR